MIDKVRHVLSHELISGTFYVFLGSMFANVIAFLLNLFYVRSLSYADYGIFASLLSIMTLAMIAGNSITTIIVKFSADFYARNESDMLKSFYNKMIKYIFIFSLLVIVAFAVLSPVSSNFLHLNNYWYLIVAGLAVGIFYLQTLNMAFLQGMMRFGFMSLVNALSSIVKIITGIIFVYLGFRAFSGLWAIFFMGAGAFLIAFVPLKKVLSQKSEKMTRVSLREILPYALPAFFAVFFMTSFTSTDVILVKHFFDPQKAAFYAGLSLVGKVIFYFTAPIPTVMFPLLIKRYTTGRNFLNLFYLSLFLVFIPSLAISIFYFIFPSFTVNLFLGGKEYYSISKYLGFFGLYLTVFSMVNVCVNFFLSLGKTKIVYPVFIAAFAQVALITLFHRDFSQVIGISLSISMILLLALFAIFVKVYGARIRIKESNLPLNNEPI